MPSHQSVHFHIINNECIIFGHFGVLILCVRDSVQNLASAVPVDKPEVGVVALDSALQEQERIITMSYALASEASLKSKLVAGQSFMSSVRLSL